MKTPSQNVKIKRIVYPILMWRKVKGCNKEFGFQETIKRIFKEITRLINKSVGELDLSFVTDNLAIGAAPKTSSHISLLKNRGYTNVLDLRAERKKHDPLVITNQLSVHWIPTYDDWQPKPNSFYDQLFTVLSSLITYKGSRIFICCGEGEHRAPLGGVVALIEMGFSLHDAVALIKKSRNKAELLPVYMLSLKEYLEITFNLQFSSKQFSNAD